MPVRGAWTAETSYVIGAAKNGFSTCRSCEEKIATANLRVGVIYSHRNGYILLNWHHFSCFQKNPKTSIKDVTELEGIEHLSPEHRSQVANWIATVVPISSKMNNTTSSSIQHTRVHAR